MEGWSHPQPLPIAMERGANDRRLRMWPAILALYFLAPLSGEVISGSTPPLLFVQPFGFIFAPLLYGSSAILMHEVVARRRLGWRNILLLGGAFGVFQEGLVVQTFFTYVVKSSPAHDIGSYGALGGISWYWATNLFIYHAIISMALPFIMLGLFFPHRAARPWLGVKGTVAFIVWLLVPCGLLAINTAFSQFAHEGYHGPSLAAYLLVAAILAALILLGCFARFPAAPPDLTHAAPRLWTVRLTSFGLMLLLFIFIGILPHSALPAWGAILFSSVIGALGLWQVRVWSTRAGWDARHRLAIVMGVVAYFTFFFAPLVEFGLHLPERNGLALADLIIFAALCLYARRLKMQGSTISTLVPIPVHSR